ncbi:hypothetical protein GCM10029992_56230 [Glycomyces albus]
MAGGDLPQQRAPVGPVGVEPFDVGEDDEFLRAEGLGEGRGGGVGVEVVEHAFVVERDGGDHRDAPGVDDVVDRGGVDAGHVADPAHVDPLAVHVGPAALGGEQPRVLAAHADRVRAVVVDEAHQLAADLADQDHADHVGGLGCGHAQAAPELGLDVELGEHGRDLGAAAVDDDGLDADLAQEHHVGGERVLELGFDHGVAAVLDHDDVAGEALQPRQGLDERLGLAECGLQVRS